MLRVVEIVINCFKNQGAALNYLNVKKTIMNLIGTLGVEKDKNYNILNKNLNIESMNPI